VKARVPSAIKKESDRAFHIHPLYKIVRLSLKQTVFIL